jgi:hypothetical protein
MSDFIEEIDEEEYEEYQQLQREGKEPNVDRRRQRQNRREMNFLPSSFSRGIFGNGNALMDDNFPGFNVGPNFHRNFFRANRMDSNSDHSEEEEDSAQAHENYTIIRRNGASPNIIIFGNGPIGEGGLNIGRGGLTFDSMNRFEEIFRHLLDNMGVINQNQQRPASQETVENLKEVDITEDMYEENDKGKRVPPN